MTKPYYNPKTKETYLLFKTPDFSIRAITGSVFLENHSRDLTKGFTVYRNQFGEIVKREEFNRHFACLGEEKCFICGKVLK
jgi:hypothetical protein